MDEKRKLHSGELNSLLHMVVDRYGLDPANTYIEFTWWDNVFKPMIEFDCGRDGEKSWGILVFGDDNCNTFYKRSDGVVVPTGFWINKDAAYIDQVVHRPTTLKWLMDNPMLLEHDEVRFLFANSPINYYVGINLFKTRVYRNLANECVLAFYADDRDSGEYRPFSDMNPGCIEFIDDNN